MPIEEVARCQYKTLQIIFPLNLQTITITLDVVKCVKRVETSVSSPSSSSCRQARHSQNARVELRHDEPSGIWAFARAQQWRHRTEHKPCRHIVGIFAVNMEQVNKRNSTFFNTTCKITTVSKHNSLQIRADSTHNSTHGTRQLITLIIVSTERQYVCCSQF